eukprot:gene12583-biopygen9499
MASLGWCRYNLGGVGREWPGVRWKDLSPVSSKTQLLAGYHPAIVHDRPQGNPGFGGGVNVVGVRNLVGREEGTFRTIHLVYRLLPGLIHIVCAPAARPRGGSLRGAKARDRVELAPKRGKSRSAGSKRPHAAGKSRETAETFADGVRLVVQPTLRVHIFH